MIKTMRDLSSVDFKDNVRYIARREVKSLGIKAPKNKSKNPILDEFNKEGVFGVYLDKAPSVNVGEDFYCSVPKFLVDATKFLRQHLMTEGLFRKSGSIQRQKVLRKRIEDQQGISPDAQAHDVASLLKQFFRLLPEPLLTNHLHDSFMKTQRLDGEENQRKAILLLCLMLPISHLHTLQFITRFIAEVASHSTLSKMGTSNLAIVLTPNLIHNPKKEGNISEKCLRDQTTIVDTLLKNAHNIGMVSDEVYERAKLIGDDGTDGLTSSGDELDENPLRSRSKQRAGSRARTASISGFVSGLGQRLKNNSKTPVPQRHRRSKSVKAEFMRNKNKYQVEEVIIKAKDDAELENFAARSSQRMSMRVYNKRKPAERNTFALSPASKRRALLRDLNADVAHISNPKLVSAPAHMFSSSLKPITPTQPVAEMVKSTRNNVVTSKVKVVDTSTYVPSPENRASPAKLTSPRPNTRSKVPAESPLSRGSTQTRETSRKTNARRNPSGATRCFNSSPRLRQRKTSCYSPTPQEVGQRLSKRNLPTDQNDASDPEVPPQSFTDVSHMSVDAEAEPMEIDNSCQSVKTSRVLYTGPDEPTPCKPHSATPPVPALLNRNLKAHFIESKI